MRPVFKTAAPYQQDAMNLPVTNVDEAIPFYEKKLGFQVVARHEAPIRSVVLTRDRIQIGLAFRVFFVVAPDGLCYMLGQPG